MKALAIIIGLTAQAAPIFFIIKTIVKNPKSLF